MLDVLSPYEYVYLQRELDPSTNAVFLNAMVDGMIWRYIEEERGLIGKLNCLIGLV